MESNYPIFYPNDEEFKDFYKYMLYVETELQNKHVGICKIVPPKGWYERDYSHSKLSTMMVRDPVKQVVSCNGAGIYTVVLYELKNCRLSKFIDFSAKNYCNDSYEDKIMKFWKSIGCTSHWDHPIYGADMVGTLFDKDCSSSWNLNKIDSLLRYFDRVPGVNCSMLYIGSWRSTFAYHVEDMNLFSINYLHTGACKTWYSVAPQDKCRFESMANSFFPSEYSECSEHLRHKTKLFSPRRLRENGITYKIVKQDPGEFVITLPGSYHAGFNHGFNIAEATNFATPNWLQIGKLAKYCQCRPDSVHLDVRRLEALYYRDKIRHNGYSKYSPSTIATSIDDHRRNESLCRLICVCKRIHKLKEVDDEVYSCIKCNVKCHIICISKEVPTLPELQLCDICYDIEYPSSEPIEGMTQNSPISASSVDTPLKDSKSLLETSDVEKLSPVHSLNDLGAKRRLLEETVVSKRSRGSQTMNSSDLADIYLKFISGLK